MTETKADYFLDITQYICPMTFVRTTLFLEGMAVGASVAVRLNAGEPLENVPRAARDQGHRVIDIAAEDSGRPDGVHIVMIQKA